MRIFIYFYSNFRF